MARVLLLLSRTLCCLALVLPSPGAAAPGADGVVYAAAPEERGAYRVEARGGQEGHFGYNTGDGTARVEVRRDDGSVIGSYRYFDPNGKQVVRSYIADDKGFRVLGNDLPISLDTPAYKVEGAPAFTGAVEGTQDYAIPPSLSPGSARTVQPGSLSQSISEQYALQPMAHVDDQLVQLLAAPAEGLQAQVLREHQELQAQQMQQMQELQAGLIAQQQVNIQKQADTIALQQARYGGPVNNELTGGSIYPYYEYPQDLPYDFPAGFAYPGRPVVRQSEAYPDAIPRQYIIGKRVTIQTPEPTTSTSNTTTTTTTPTTTPAPPVAGDDPGHPEIEITPVRLHSEVSTHAPVAPHKGDDPDHPEVDIAAGHTHNEGSTHPPTVDDKTTTTTTPAPPVAGDDPDHPEVDITAGYTHNEITAGHTHPETLEVETVENLREVNNVSDNLIPSKHSSYYGEPYPIITFTRQKPTAIHNPDPIFKRPLWNYNDYSSFNTKNSYNAAIHNPDPIFKRPLWNYNDYSSFNTRNRITDPPLRNYGKYPYNYGQNPYVRRQYYERVRPSSGRPKLPHCPGWCPE